MKSLYLAAAALLALPFPLSVAAAQPATEAPIAPRYTARQLSAAEATLDVTLLRRALETVHPGLYRYTAKAEIDAAFGQLEVEASVPITELALHGAIARLLAAIHCDHTKAEMSDELVAFRAANPTHLPLRFQLIEADDCCLQRWTTGRAIGGERGS